MLVGSVEVEVVIVPVVLHTDLGGRLPSLAAPKTTRVFEGGVARVHPDGDPLNYAWGDEYRDLAELRRIVDQLPGTPVTLLHPDGLISSGVEAQIVGRILSARLDGDFAVAEFMIFDDAGLAAIEDGQTLELSLGYTSRSDEKRFQRDIKVDHLALVPRGRCQTCALRADHVAAASDACTCNEKVVQAETSSLKSDVQGLSNKCPCKDYAIANSVDMADTAAHDTKVALDELQKALAEAVTEAAGQKARADQAETLATAEKTRADRAESDLETAKAEAINARKDFEAEKARADQAQTDATAAIEKAKMDAAGVLDSQVAERVTILSAANKVLGEAGADGKLVDRKAMSNRDIKVAIVRHVDGEDVELDDKKSTDYVEALYLGALRRHDKAGASRADARVAIQTLRTDGALAADPRKAERAARDESNKRVADAWRASSKK